MISPLDLGPSPGSGEHEHAGVYAGKNMGGFRLLREIASGGMASVYLAYKAGPGGFGQVSAIKVVHPHLAKDREFVEMFLDEARIAATINHPNVARVLDFGRAEGTYYLAMEHLMGETWAEVQKRVVDGALRDDLQHLPLLVAHVIERACEGLHAAHEAKDPAGHALQIVHRDVSPQNLFVTYDGSVRVLDFGIASAAERLHTTRHGTVKGRFAYMSPEQMHAQKLDRRSDVWSLGVILWEGLARRRLFHRDTEAETIGAVTNEPLPSFPRDVGAVPEALVNIAMRALERDPAQRFESAREMGVELARFVSRLTPAPEVEVSSRMARLFREDIQAKERLLAEAAENAAADSQEAILPDDPSDIDTVPPKRRSELKLAEALAQSEEVKAVSDGEATRPRSPWLIPALFFGVFSLSLLLYPFLKPEPVASPSPESSLQKQADATAKLEPSGTQNAVTTSSPDEPEVSAVAPSKEEATTEPVTKKSEARPTRGTLNITAPGCWAFVYDGNQKLGTTPGSFKLSAGEHTLRIEIGGKKPAIAKNVTITPGATARVRVPCK